MELSLDLSLVYVPRTVGEFLGEVSKVRDGGQKLSKLDEFVKRLEDEMRKIEAFKRELPLCMLLLNDAIVRLKEEAMQCKNLNDGALKGNSDGDGRAEMESDKKDWMSSVQLWGSGHNINLDSQRQDSKSESRQRSEEDDDQSTCENPIQLCNYRSRGGAFVPFKSLTGFEGSGGRKEEEKEVVSHVTRLSLLPPVSELGTFNLMSRSKGNNCLKIQNKSQQQQQQSSKKQRRCWSPDLHRRFVEALQQLGGSQVATPKQIRELMQVDGLTNDEVKSHLQKYRLHVRKLPVSSGIPANGLWMTPDNRKDHTEKNSSQSNSPQGPFHGTGSGKGISSSGGDSMEEEDDDNSESHSWNGGLHKPGEANVQC